MQCTDSKHKSRNTGLNSYKQIVGVVVNLHPSLVPTIAVYLSVPKKLFSRWVSYQVGFSIAYLPHNYSFVSCLSRCLQNCLYIPESATLLLLCIRWYHAYMSTTRFNFIPAFFMMAVGTNASQSVSDGK